LGQSPFNSIRLRPGANNRVSPTLAQMLSAATQSLSSQNVQIRVTEAWPPTVAHVSPCHIDGTCVDVNLVPQVISFNPIQAADAIRIGRTFDALIAAGGRPEFEVRTAADATSLRAALQANGFQGNYRILVVSQITAPHWSYYQNSR
jgi:D-alanyl-D-alanine dipeptidase